MRASEIVMTLCAIDDHAKEYGLSKGQKAWRTRLKNQLRIHHISWARGYLNEAIKDFFLPINNRSAYNTGLYDIKFRKEAVSVLRKSRLKYHSLKK